MFRILALTSVFLIGALISFGQTDPMGCPDIKVTRPNGITPPGGQATFVAKVATSRSDTKYEWTVSGGMIEKGQDTPVIRVRTSLADAGGVIKATVTVIGLFPWCKAVVSESAVIDTPAGCGAPMDSFGNLKPNDIRARIDAFLAELMNNPTNQGLIIFVVDEGEKLDQTNPRFKLITDHIKYREFDLSRIVFKFEQDKFVNTNVWRVPPGAEMPCPSCVTIHGTEVK